MCLTSLPIRFSNIHLRAVARQPTLLLAQIEQDRLYRLTVDGRELPPFENRAETPDNPPRDSVDS